MAGKIKTFGIRFKIKEAQTIEERAALKEMTLSEYVRECIRMFTGFDDDFLNVVSDAAEKMGVTVPKFIQNTLLQKSAQDKAEAKIFGTSATMKRLDYTETENSFLTTQQVPFNSLVQLYEEDIIKKMAKGEKTEGK